jgi:hypothetical protein
VNGPRTFLATCLTACLLGASGCDRSAPEVAAPGPEPATPVSTPAPAPAPAGPPRIAFETVVRDFGAMRSNEVRTTTFPFVNAGGGVLTVEEIATTCGCTAATLTKRRYQPGEQGVIEVTFDPTGSGAQEKHIKVVSNGTAESVTRLTIKADIVPLVTVAPKSVEFGVRDFGERHVEDLLVSSADPDFDLLSVRATNPNVSVVRARRDAEGEHLEVVVDAAASWGALFSWLELDVRVRLEPDAEPVVHTRKVRVNGKIFGAISATPDTFRFGVEPGERFERTIRFTHREQRPFNVLSATVTAPRLQDPAVEVRRESADMWLLVFTAVGGPNHGACRGTVRLTTDVPGELVIDVPVTGVVRQRPRNLP